MSEEPKIVYQEHSLDDVMQHWVKDYDKPVDGYEFFVDVYSQKVIFKLYLLGAENKFKEDEGE